MPPAFLFPESDPPPSDLIPEHNSSSSTNSLTDNGNGPNHQLSYNVPNVHQSLLNPQSSLATLCGYISSSVWS